MQSIQAKTKILLHFLKIIILGSQDMGFGLPSKRVNFLL